MRPVALIFRLARMDPRRRRLLAEALVELMRASAVIAFAPFRRAVAFGSRPLGRAEPTSAEAAETIATVRWSVEAVAARVPWRTVCFQMGLALQRMLRRRGIPAQLYYGIGKATDGKLQAHVWVAADQAIAIGGESAARFATVAVFPAV
ncbi:MAG: lasso peptide biosynthesis B2 protein [Sphingomicrobium sp.]